MPCASNIFLSVAITIDSASGGSGVSHPRDCAEYKQTLRKRNLAAQLMGKRYDEMSHVEPETTAKWRLVRGRCSFTYFSTSSPARNQRPVYWLRYFHDRFNFTTEIKESQFRQAKCPNIFSTHPAGSIIKIIKQALNFIKFIGCCQGLPHKEHH